MTATKIAWTKDKLDFMAEAIPGHTEQEIRELFLAEYGIELTRGQIGNTKARLGIKSGTHGGQFVKGQTPHNKGKTWDEAGFSKEAQQAMRSTCFKPRNMPHNALDKPIGYERINRDGYIEVKIAERPSRRMCNDNFKMKHHIVWEQANGQPIPPSTQIVFADGDKRNFDPENLVAVSRSDWSVICRERIKYSDRESLGLAVDIAKLRHTIRDVTCNERDCKVCGTRFKPRFPGQRRCDGCLGRTNEQDD